MLDSKTRAGRRVVRAYPFVKISPCVPVGDIAGPGHRVDIWIVNRDMELQALAVARDEGGVSLLENPELPLRYPREPEWPVPS
jgi:hypothetical protein